MFSDLATNNFNQLFANLAADERCQARPMVCSPRPSEVRFTIDYYRLATVHLANVIRSVLWLDHLPPNRSTSLSYPWGRATP